MGDLNIDSASPLPGTVKFYDQHLVVCSGHTDWPFRAETEGFLADLKQATNEIELPGSLRITACEAVPEGEGTDLLLFPRNIRLLNLGAKDIPALLCMLQGKEGADLQTVALERPVWLVCGHRNRDPRCGRCGPAIQAAIKARLTELGLANAADVWRSSHLGGHRFAGVMVCYPSGNWYGRVTEKDVPSLVQAELLDQVPLAGLWRGRIWRCCGRRMPITCSRPTPIWISEVCRR